MHFLEPINFNKSSLEINAILNGQLTSSAQKTVRWVKWDYQLKSLIPNPDVCLIFAANENWHSIKKMVDNTTASSVVLYGCNGSLLALPVLTDIHDIDALLQYVSLKSEKSTYITTEPKLSAIELNRTWKKTIPMQLPC
jgi:hypothetical protein